MRQTINIEKSANNGVVKDIDKSDFLGLGNSSTSRGDLFLFATALGLSEGRRKPLANKESFVRTSYVEKEFPLYRCLLFKDSIQNNLDNIDLIQEMDNSFNIAEEYANVGFEKLKEILSQKTDDFLFAQRLIMQNDKMAEKLEFEQQ